MALQYVPIISWISLILLLLSLDLSAGEVTREQLIDTQAVIPVLDYVDTPEFLDSLRTRAEPVLLKNTPAHLRWSAMKTWKPIGNNPSQFYLSKASEKTVGVKRNSSPKFPIGCCELKPMTQKDFWIAMAGLSSNEFMYFNADMNVLDAVLRSDIHPPFFGVTQAKEISSGERKVITNVWMGSKGSTAALHHDPFDNFFVQIYGSKKFTLFSPDLQHALYVYPKTHPSSRQSQVNIDEPDTRRFPKLEQFGLESGLELVVHPGDVLYLPPFWFHQVESLESAISVNTWFISPDVEMMDAAWTEPLPFSSEWSDEGFALGLKVLLHNLIHKVLGHPRDTPQQAGTLVNKFIQDLVDSRFKPLYGDDPTVESDLLKGIKTTEDPHLRVHLREQSELDSSAFISSDSLPHLRSICAIPTSELYESDPEFKSTLDRGVRAISRHFMTVERNSGFQIIHLNDFVEDLVGQTVGDKSVYHYLQSCFLNPETETDIGGPF
jgi:hypothetical protein